MEISDKKIEALLSTPDPKRYSHFIKVVADQRKAWGLYSDGWALSSTSEGQQVFPLWPAKEYAERCALGEWSGYTPKEIDLDSIFEELIPSLKESGTLLGVFQTPAGRGVLPGFERLERDLREELSKLE